MEAKAIIKGDISNLESELKKANQLIDSTYKDINSNQQRQISLEKKLQHSSEAQIRILKSLEQTKKSLSKQFIDGANLTEEEYKENKKLEAEYRKIEDTIKRVNGAYTTRNKLLNIELRSVKQNIEANKTLISQQQSVVSRTEKLTAVQNEATASTEKQKKSTESLANATIRYLRWAGTIAGVVYAANRAWRATLGVGLEVNKMMEDNTSGIAALLSANTQMVLSNGQVVNSYEKFKIGQTVAAQTMEQLRKASIKTYATFPQLTEIFQQAIGQTLGMGDSFGETTDSIIANTVKLSQRMSNIAGAIGMPMDRVREEIRSLLSGNVSTDSLISTMIFGSPSEANKAIRDAKTRGANGVKDLLDTMLAPFDALEGVQSFTRSLLQLQDAWSQTMSKVSTPIFEDLKVVFKDLATDINNNQKEIQESFESFYGTAKVAGEVLGNTISGISKGFGVLGEALDTTEVKLIAGAIAVRALTTAMMANPIIAGLTTVTIAASNWEKIGDIFVDVAEDIARYSDAEYGTNLLKNVEANKAKFEEFKKATEEANAEIEKYKGIVEGSEYKAFSIGIEKEDIQKGLEEAKRAMLSVQKELEEAAIAGDKKRISELQKEYQALALSATAMTKEAQKNATLQTLITVDADYLEKITKENLKDLGEIVNLEKDIAKAKSEILQYEKRIESSKKAGKKDLESEKAILELNKRVENDLAEISEIQTKELEKQSAERKKEFDKIAKRTAQVQKWNEDADAREKARLDELEKKEQRYLREKGKLDASLIVAQEKLNSLSVIYSSTQDDIISKYVKELATAEKEVGKINSLNVEEDRRKELLGEQEQIKNTILAQQAQELENATAFRQTMIETVDIMQDGFQDFFDFSKDGFLDLSRLAKGLGNDILGSFSKNLSSGISTSLMGSIFGSQKADADLKSMGLSLVGDVYKGTINGQNVEVDKSGNILSGGNLSSVASAASSLKSASSLFSSGLSGVLYAPSATVGGLAGSAYGAGYAGLGDFLSGSAATLSGGSSAGMSAAAQLGGTSTLALGGAVVGYGVGSLGDQLFGADTKAGIGGAIGGAIGTAILPGVGTAIGSVLGSAIGGMFGSTKVKDSGIFAGEDVSASMGMDELSRYTDYKKKSWFSSKSWTTYTDLTASERVKIEGIFESYDYLLAQLGDFDEIVVSAGKYTGTTFQDEIAKSLLGEFIDENATLDTIYSAWKEYAKEVDKTTGEAITEALSGLVQTERGFTEWALSLTDGTDALAYKADYLAKDFENLAKMMDAENVTVDNYTESMRKALQENFTAENIQLWEQLGNSLMSATDATRAYTDALAQEEQVKLEATLRSANNIGLFLDSLRTEEYLVKRLADAMGVDLATNAEELASLFKQLAYDADGLTDIELDLLNRNKALLESTELYAEELDNFNAILDDTTKNISILEGALGSITAIIDRLKDSAFDSSYSLDKYYTSMSETLALSGGSDFEAYKESLDKTISASSALFESSNFMAERDQEFAQLVAANQFETLEDATLDQIDYLRLIEENTKEQIDAILLLAQSLGAKVNQALFPYESAVNEAYQNVLGRDAESAGSAYWQEQIASGTGVTTGNIGVSVGAAAVEGGEISRADYVAKLYTDGLNRVPTAEEIDYWANQSTTPTTQLASLFDQLDPNFTAFANGGIVTAPTMGLIGEAGYNEAVIPLKNPSDPLNQAGVMQRLQALETENRMLRNSMDRLVDISERQLSIQKATFSETTKVYDAVSA